MRPGGFRNDWGFVGCSAAPIALLTASPALATPLSTATVVANAPLAIALGAAGFAVLAMLALRRAKKQARRNEAQAAEQVAGLRALADDYEALLSASREIVVLWTGGSAAARIFGQVATLLPPSRRPAAILDFHLWLDSGAATALAQAVEALRVDGRSFVLNLKAQDGRPVRAAGTLVAGGAALRLRAGIDTAAEPLPQPQPAADQSALRILLSGLPEPAYLRDANGRLGFANRAYLDLASAAGRSGSTNAPGEIVDAARLERHLAALRDEGKPQPLVIGTRQGAAYDLVELPVPGGSAAFLRPRATAVTLPAPAAGAPRIAAIVDALATPVAIFDAQRRLVASNRAYAALWKFDPAWLKAGLEERTILDQLRAEGQLPAEPDYRAWVDAHFAAYALKTGQQVRQWHLPDGRTLRVTAAPAGAEGGVIYLFEDQSRELMLLSQNRAMASVQRSTLNALTEAVAVFGTNGRLQLFNPRLSSLWKLPINFLDTNPHIDQMVDAVAAAIPEDGAATWRELKRDVIDLDPSRPDSKRRLMRADGRLIDYALTRLPDGQRLMTFLDVTDSANYSRVLKERNDALVTADRLKDAFVQNVSYELRSPLTNIIGFADLLASPEIGPLNERQRTYTDYIRASSVTLGVLIDNILDLATVDAGIAELNPEPQDVAALVDKARAGLAATFPTVDGTSGLNLKVELAPNLPPIVADGTRVVQILYNLLSSAARFSAPGSEVRLLVGVRGDRIVFTVEDEGTAMNDAVRAALLGQGEIGPTGRQRGAGLGLAIVRSFVALHGGTVTVEPRQPGGSRVVVSLPRDAAAAAAASSAAE